MGVAIDGKEIAVRIASSLQDAFSSFQNKRQNLSFVMIGDDPVSEKFVRYKLRFGKRIGIFPRVFSFSKDISEDEFIFHFLSIIRSSNAVVLQLPLPSSFHEEKILSLIPPEKDIDLLSQQSLSLFSQKKIPYIPPVTNAILEIFHFLHLPFREKRISLLGFGKLVGKPFHIYLKRENINHTLIRSSFSDEERRRILRNSDIIVSGIGTPHFVKEGDISDDVILIDAGTSEAKGRLLGDIHPSCYTKASFYTPVPGGIGPLTIASLYKNFLFCVQNYD